MEEVRSFIAIELPVEVKAGLKQIQDNLKCGNPTLAQWVNPNNIHLTLKFLGNVGLDKIEMIKLGIQQAAQTINPFILEIKELGAFPNLKRIKIIWVGLGGNLGELLSLQNRIEANIGPLGFPTEKRPFTPHLTVARVKNEVSSKDLQFLEKIIAKTKIESNLIIKVNSISLMKSQLTRGGAIYTRLCSVELKPSCQ